MGRFIEKAEQWLCAVALLTTAMILFVNVVMRYCFSASTSWAEESIRYLMVWITFIGGSVCVRQSAHIRMDFLMSFLSGSARRFLDRTVYLLSALFCGIMTFYGARLVAFTLSTGQASPALGIPMWWVYLAVPLGSGLMAFQFLCRCVNRREVA